MADMDQALLQQLAQIIQQIARGGGTFASTLSNLTAAGNASAAAQNASTTATQKAVDSSVNEMQTLHKKLRLTSKSFTLLHNAVAEVADRVKIEGTLSSNFVKEISTSYKHAKNLLEVQVGETFKTWNEVNTEYPKILRQQISNVTGGLNLAIDDFSKTLKFNDYVDAQQQFIEAMSANNNKLDATHIDLLANLRKLGNELGDPEYFKSFAKNKTQAKAFAKVLEKHTNNTALTADELKLVNEYFDSIPKGKLKTALTDTENKLKTFIQGINKASKVTNELGGSLKHKLLDKLESAFGNTGSIIRNAIMGGGGGDIAGDLTASISGPISAAMINGIRTAFKNLVPLMTNEAKEWMTSGVELHDDTLRNTSLTQDAYLKIAAQSKMMIRSMRDGQEGLDKVLTDQGPAYVKMMGGNIEAGNEMAAKIARINQVAGGSTQSFITFQNGVADTAKWADKLGKTTGMTYGAGLELYSSLMSNSKITDNINRVKGKERLSIQKSVQSQIQYAASLGMGSEAIKTFVEATTTAGRVNLVTGVTTKAIMTSWTGVLNSMAQETAAISQKDQSEWSHLYDNQNRNAEQQARFNELTSKIEIKRLDHEAELVSQQQAYQRQIDTTPEGSEANTTAKSGYDQITTLIEQQRWQHEQWMSMPGLDPAVLTTLKTVADNYAQTSSKNDQYIAALKDRGADVTDANIAAERNKDLQKLLADAQTHEKKDLSTNIGELTLKIQQWIDAFKGSQQGQGVMAAGGVAAGFLAKKYGGRVLGAGIRAARTGIGAVAEAGGVGAAAKGALGAGIGKIGLKGASKFLGPAGLIYAIYDGLDDIYKGTVDQGNVRVQRVLDGTATDMEKKYTTLEEVNKYQEKLGIEITKSIPGASEVAQAKKEEGPVQPSTTPSTLAGSAAVTVEDIAKMQKAGEYITPAQETQLQQAMIKAALAAMNYNTKGSVIQPSTPTAGYDPNAGVIQAVKNGNDQVAKVLDTSMTGINATASGIDASLSTVSQPLTQLLKPTVTTPTTTPTDPNAPADVPLMERLATALELLTTAINSKPSDMTSANNSLKSIDKTTSDWFKIITDDKKAETSTSLADLFNKTGSNSSSNVRG